MGGLNTLPMSQNTQYPILNIPMILFLSIVIVAVYFILKRFRRRGDVLGDKKWLDNR